MRPPVPIAGRRAAGGRGGRFALALLTCLLALLACALPGAAPPATGVSPTGVQSNTPAATVPATLRAAPATGASPATGDIQFVPGSSKKVCQLVGETDRQRNAPTLNQTETQWGLVGNDLGYSFEHDGNATHSTTPAQS